MHFSVCLNCPVTNKKIFSSDGHAPVLSDGGSELRIRAGRLRDEPKFLLHVHQHYLPHQTIYVSQVLQ